MCGILTIITNISIREDASFPKQIDIELNFEVFNENFEGTYTMVDSGIVRNLTYPITSIIMAGEEGVDIEYNVSCGTKKYNYTLVNSDRTIVPYQNIEKINYVRGVEVIVGCTDPLALNYNEHATINDNSCLYELNIEGCTNPLALNYNPLATIEDGSCKYDTTSIVNGGILGCTNELSSNYNPLATVNDGSCIFISGCTMEMATNYNPLAVIDDGTCECSEYKLFFAVDNQEYINFSNATGTTCMTVVKYDLGLSLNCFSFLSYLADNDLNLIDTLKNINISLITIDENNNMIESHDIFKWDENVSLYGEEETCELLTNLYKYENDSACDETISEIFDDQYTLHEIILTGDYTTPFKIGMRVNNVQFDHYIHLNNIDIKQYCTSEVVTCKLLPINYGFKLNKLPFNKISLSNLDVINSKEIDFKINPINYIDKDVINYFNDNGYYGLKDKLFSLNLEEIKIDLINVKRRKIDVNYHHQRDVYDIYLNNQNSCSFKNNNLEYDFIDESYNLVPPYWREVVNTFIDPTLITNRSTYYYSNNSFHNSKHRYKQYTLNNGCNTGATLDFKIISSDPCTEYSDYKSRFELIGALNGICEPCNNSGITYSYFDDGISESGRLIQYTGATFTGITEVINFETNIFSDCNLICPDVNVEITNYVTTSKLTVDIFYITTGINDISEISVFIDGLPYSFGINFDPITQSGVIRYNNHDSTLTVKIVGSNECGTDSDIINNVKP